MRLEIEGRGDNFSMLRYVRTKSFVPSTEPLFFGAHLTTALKAIFHCGREVQINLNNKGSRSSILNKQQLLFVCFFLRYCSQFNS